MVASQVFPVAFIGGPGGRWSVTRTVVCKGAPLAAVSTVDVIDTHGNSKAEGGAWVLRGVAGHVRYVERREKTPLDAVSPPLDRPEATRAALIPIRKSNAWWALAHDERRAIFEERSHHIAHSMEYLPRIARRLYHARDLGEPFDFYTWFEFAPEHESAFEDLLAKLRSREEWTYVEREVDIRLAR